MQEPETRGVAARDALSQLDRFRHGLGDRVMGRIPSESLRVIEGAAPLDWVQLRHEHHVTRAISAELGDEGVD
jgi:hypothetical protein